jgi:hypothetical protein
MRFIQISQTIHNLIANLSEILNPLRKRKKIFINSERAIFQKNDKIQNGGWLACMWLNLTIFFTLKSVLYNPMKSNLRSTNHHCKPWDRTFTIWLLYGSRRIFLRRSSLIQWMLIEHSVFDKSSQQQLKIKCWWLDLNQYPLRTYWLVCQARWDEISHKTEFYSLIFFKNIFNIFEFCGGEPSESKMAAKSISDGYDVL